MNNKEPEKIEFKNNKRDTGKILTIVFFTLAVLILLITLLLVYTPLKDLFFKKPTAEVTSEELAEETTLKEQNTQEPTEETEKTSEEPTTKEESTEETTNSETTEETTKEEGVGFIHADEAKIQGYVEDIDYENKIITIKNEITGEIEKLDDFSEYLSITHYGSLKSREFEDIKVGYYIFAITEKELHFDIFYEPTDKIKSIWLTEEFPPPGWPKEEE